LLQPETSSLGQVVESRSVTELPLNGRDFSQLTLLQAGVTASPSTQQQVDRGMGTQVSIAGARPNQISYQLDGTDANTQGNGSPGSAAGGLLGGYTGARLQPHLPEAFIRRRLGVLVLAISTEFGVLLSSRYAQERAKGHDPRRALERTYRSTGAAVLASGATALAGFGVLILSSITMLRDFGFVTLVDLSVSLAGVLLVLPAVLSISESEDFAESMREIASALRRRGGRALPRLRRRARVA